MRGGLVLALVQALDVDEAHFLELRADVVEVEAELAGGELRPLLVLTRDTLLGGLGGFGGEGTRHDDDAVVVGDDDIAWPDRSSAADDRDVDRAQRRLDRALGRDRPRP